MLVTPEIYFSTFGEVLGQKNLIFPKSAIFFSKISLKMTENVYFLWPKKEKKIKANEIVTLGPGLKIKSAETDRALFFIF